MELIKIESTAIAGATVQTVNARDLHAFLGVRKDFSDWIKAQVTRAHLIEKEDFLVFPQKGENPLGGRPASDYALTLEAGKHIAMMAGTPKGRQVRAYFIECERRLRQDVTVMPPTLTEDDRKILFGTFTNIARREISAATDKIAKQLTDQNRHLWRAITRSRNAISLQGAGFVEIGTVYKLAGLAPSGLPGQGKLSGNISRALDAYCKRHACLSRSAQVGSREVTHWPEDAVIAWLSEQGHSMIRAHLATMKPPPQTELRLG